MTARVMIVDDHEIVRFALRGVLEAEQGIEVVGEAATGAEALERIAQVAPDVVLLDLHLPDMDGIDVCGLLCANDGAPRIVVLTSYDDDAEVFGALDAGAFGYLMKDVSPSALVEAVRTVADGTMVFDSGIARRVIDGRRPVAGAAVADGLSVREQDVLERMAKGMSNREIAASLWISEPTVKTHVSHILRKLGQTDRTRAVLEGIRMGIVSAPGVAGDD